MSFASPRPLLSFLLCSALTALGGCETPHSAGFAKVRTAPEKGAPAAGAAAARALPEGSAEGVPEHLLHEYAQREPAAEAEVVTWDLPAKSKRLVVELLVLAARDEEKGLRGVMSRQARWGIPDRREFEARPVFAGDDGRAFLDTLRQVSARLGRKENLNCPPIMPPAAQNYVRNGAEPMWCFYSSNDGLDILAFKLVLESGSARVDYVGMLTERPTRMSVRNGVQPPPMTPIVRRPPGTAERMPGLPEGAIPMPPPGTGGPLIINPAATPDSPVTTPIVVPGAPPAPSPVKATEPAASPATSPAKATEPAATKPASKPADPKAKAEEPAPTPAPSI